RNQRALGQVQQVLVEGPSKRSEAYLQGRNSANKVVIFPQEAYQSGQYLKVRIQDCTAATLFGEVCA
ncbi:MAG: TRAM domain-containing protein, partial [Bacteroidota bacterium]